ncbi:MAG TPA: PP2C family protein-serine/threonine phosphatase [Candidatus Aquilonibacter sp.]|nr:PP2C family protein-serine/threonine phosphatase [Candidatus Aquilonibacter sp.]
MSSPDPFTKDSLKQIRRGASPADWAALGIVVLALVFRIPAALGHELPRTGFLTFVGLIAAVYLFVRLIIVARRTLLWRLRNRLIVAYVFIAVVPILLLLTMVGLAGYLLELQIGAHLLRDDLKQRENMIAADASAIAGVVGREPDLKPVPAQPEFGRGGRGRGRGDGRGRGGAFGPNGPPGPPPVLSPEQLENMKILTRPSIAGVIAAAQTDWPDLNVELNVGSELIRDKTSGQFAGLVEFGNRLVFAAVQVLPVAGGRNTIFVAAPVTPALLDSFPSKLGPIQFELLTPVPGSQQGGSGGGRGQNGGSAGQGRSSGAGRAPPLGPGPPANGPNGAARGRGFGNGRGREPRQIFTLHGTPYYVGEQISSTHRVIVPRRFLGDVQVSGLATFDALRAQRNNNGTDLPVFVTYSFRLSAVNGDLLTSLGDYAPLIMEFLFAAFIVFLVLELVAFIIGVILSRTITGSVADLYDATLRIRSGDLSHRIHIERQDQLGALAQSFNEMTGSVSELIEEQRQRQRLENEVSIAREVQRQLFPKKLPSIPGLELAAICRPARSVSGDYYDIIPLGGSRVGIAVADISGKGIFASLLMASLQAALRSAASMNGTLDTARVVERLNQHLLQTTADDRYATLFYGVYDTQTRILNYTNAGHLPPLLVTDGKVQTLAEGGTVIGLIEDAAYKQGTVAVPPGSILMVFSDGLTEPENVFGEEFGVDRLRDELLRERNAPANKLAEDLIESAERWSGSAEQADDMTVVIARMA